MYSKTKLTQTLTKLGTYDIRLSSKTDPSGRKFYSGFIINHNLDIVVYITTESYYNAHCENKFLVRYARNVGDYAGGINHFVLPNNSPFLLHEMLESPKMCNAELYKGRTK